MAKKIIFWVMPVMVLAFGLTVVGCGEEWENPVIKVENGTAFQVKTVLIEDGQGGDGWGGGTEWTLNKAIKSDPVGISSGESKSYELPTDSQAGSYTRIKVTLTVTLSLSQEATISYTFPSHSVKGAQVHNGGGDKKTLLLSGTDYNSLQLNETW